jgi:hypothetical protein
VLGWYVKVGRWEGGGESGGGGQRAVCGGESGVGWVVLVVYGDGR